ncbi:MAG: hypothetical protein WDN08_15220 [Rhizomicrobium sp.]
MRIAEVVEQPQDTVEREVDLLGMQRLQAEQDRGASGVVGWF